MSQLPLLLAEVTVVFAVALLGARLASKARAAVRHLLLVSAFGVALILPVATLVSPKITVEIAALPARDPEPLASTPTVLPPAAPAEDTIPGIGTSQTEPIPTATWLLLAWAIVALVALLPVLASLSHLRSIRRRGTPWPEGAARLAQLVHPPTGRLPAVLQDKGIAAPITGGLIQPVIVLPAGAVTWSDPHLANALLHELEHVRRHDWAVHLATRAVCALYWFHPLAWICWRRLRLEAERACDDAVLAREDAVAYADQLLALARGVKEQSAQPGLPMVSGSDLSSRIKAALDSTLPRGRAGKIAMASIVIVAAVAIATLATLRAAGPTRVTAEPVATSSPATSPAPAPAQPAITPPEPPFPYDTRVGLVSLRDDGGCLSMFNPSIAAGTRLTLVRPRSSDPAGVMEAAVGERQSGKCPASLDSWQDRGLDPTYYRITLSGGSKPANGQVFAILDPPGSIVLRDGEIVADIDGDGLREAFGTCSSTENVHYVVWTELPAQRLKRWHGNIYYAYDMEVSCIDDDVLVAPEKTVEPVNATPTSATLAMGNYIAVTESEWSIELNLDASGGATYTISSWDAGKASSTKKSDVVKGRWEMKADGVTVGFGSEYAGKTVTYKVSPCLSYRPFGKEDCSMGLDPVANTMSRGFSQPLWNSNTFKRSGVADSINGAFPAATERGTTVAQASVQKATHALSERGRMGTAQPPAGLAALITPLLTYDLPKTQMSFRLRIDNHSGRTVELRDPLPSVMLQVVVPDSGSVDIPQGPPGHMYKPPDYDLYAAPIVFKSATLNGKQDLEDPDTYEIRPGSFVEIVFECEPIVGERILAAVKASGGSLVDFRIAILLNNLREPQDSRGLVSEFMRLQIPKP